jgi:hypothetical protein
LCRALIYHSNQLERDNATLRRQLNNTNANPNNNTCQICNWTNTNCWNIGEPNGGQKWICHGCVKRELERLKAELDCAQADGIALRRDKSMFSNALSKVNAELEKTNAELEKSKQNAAYWVSQHGLEAEKRGETEHQLDLCRGNLAEQFESLERELSQANANSEANYKLMKKAEAETARLASKFNRLVGVIRGLYASEAKAVSKGIPRSSDAFWQNLCKEMIRAESAALSDLLKPTMELLCRINKLNKLGGAMAQRIREDHYRLKTACECSLAAPMGSARNEISADGTRKICQKCRGLCGKLIGQTWHPCRSCGGSGDVPHAPAQRATTKDL